MINFLTKKKQVKSHLETYKKFKNGCENNNITEKDLIDTIFIGGTNDRYRLFLNYNLKKYNLDLTNITTYPKQNNKCLCKQSLKHLFYLYNPKKNCIYIIGSECITNFTENKIKLSCLNCGRTNAKHLDKNGLCCNCMKFKCNKCYDNYIFKNNLCRHCHIGTCIGCLKKIDKKYKYCHSCNKNLNKIKCVICKKKYHEPQYQCCYDCYNEIK